MLALDDGALVLAASDITNHLACPHLTQQRLAIARGERGKPRPADDPHADLVRTRGERHEEEQLKRLTRECGGWVDLTAEPTFTREGLEARHEATLAQMRNGEPLIYQAHFFDGRWQGITDFLRRVSVPSKLGEYSYEVIDTKLAREIKPKFVHQLSLYNRLLADEQGHTPAHAYVILGDGTEEPIDLSRYPALHRHTVRRLETLVEEAAVETYPEPTEHCGICTFAAECYVRRVADDHLSLVANARRDQREALVELDLATVGTLAAAPADFEVSGFGQERFDLLRNQAALQVASRESGEPTHRHLEPERALGYAALPPPSDGDIFFDLEGDPYVADGGIEYLWGWWTTAGDYDCLWAHSVAEEKAAFERVVDFVIAARKRHPELHVYHYAPHERAKLRSLSIEYATREEEVDELLRQEVFVDLYAVVRRALQVGEDSYSLKKLERHHGLVRHERSVRAGGGSIVVYETWLETGEPDLLESIRAYNEEDCRSTLSLRNWLLGEMRTQAAAKFGVDFEGLRDPEPEPDHGPPEWLPAVEELIAHLVNGLPDDPAEDDAMQAERRLLSHLLLYHRREDKPNWWRYFDMESMTVPELIDDRDAIGGLARDESVPPVQVKRSLDYTFSFPTQEFRLKAGDVRDPTTGGAYKAVHIDDERVVVRRSASKEAPNPAAIGPGQPINVKALREALVELAESALAESDEFAAARRLLRREPPRGPSLPIGESVEALSEVCLELDRSLLPIQGPPGTGKTYRGARMILAALKAGRRVGICAPSHSVIQNMLRELESAAVENGISFSGVYKGDEYEGAQDLIEVVDENDGVTDDHNLVAGTAWLFAREEHRQAFDSIFIDEAGQFSLANAAAIGLATKSYVLLGDPQQLPQVTQADHPGGSGTSALEHLLDGASTIPPEQGVLLTKSWRMHPDVCAFVSERSYDGRLRSRDACSTRCLDAGTGVVTGTGLRAIPVEHEGRSQMSPEEVEAIATMCRELIADSTVTNDKGETKKLAASDIMVVAPYNLAVDAILRAVPAGVEVGTVDKFQGREAVVVFYAMTCSSAEEAPRGMGFLFDQHRFNVAISRAQCLAVLVYSPRLLDADAPSLRSMIQLDGLCRFAEVASPPGRNVTAGTLDG